MTKKNKKSDPKSHIINKSFAKTMGSNPKAERIRMKWYSPTVDTEWGSTISEHYNQLLVEGEFDRYFTKL